MRRAISKLILSAVLSAGLLGVVAAPAAAQDVAVTGGVDFTNQYNFRGIRQNYFGMAIWPFVDLGIPVYTGDGGLKSLNVNVGSWNSIHPNHLGDVVDDEDKWYESDFYATLGFGFSKATLGITYTAYMSPAEGESTYFPTIHELAFKVTADDSGALGKAALKPYVLVGFELTDGGQADLGAEKGIYLELGIAPGYSSDKVSVAIPVKLGLSAKDYYEFPWAGLPDDSKFGYFSVGGIVTVPLSSNWNVHGGGELQIFGDNLRTVNAFGDSGDRRATGIGSIGIGFSF